MAPPEHAPDGLQQAAAETLDRRRGRNVAVRRDELRSACEVWDHQRLGAARRVGRVGGDRRGARRLQDVGGRVAQEGGAQERGLVMTQRRAQPRLGAAAARALAITPIAQVSDDPGVDLGAISQNPP
ncbi:hypothetical protein ACU4GR_09025 (plasmid) [Methylobacterium oryzae CBMB20]